MNIVFCILYYQDIANLNKRLKYDKNVQNIFL